MCSARAGRCRLHGWIDGASSSPWLPLGAGGWFVHLNGKAYEALVAAREHRRRRDLYHSALVVALPEGRFAIESAPIRDDGGPARGDVSEGAVGHDALGRFRLFR